MKRDHFLISVVCKKLVLGSVVVLTTMMMSITNAYAIDSDGDGIDDTIDPDDDNDGILDIEEYGVTVSPGQIGWTHNNNGGTSYDGDPDASLAGCLASVDPISFGPGLVQPTSNWEWITGDVHTSTYAAAKAAGDYIEVGYSLSSDAVLDQSQQGLVHSVWGGSLGGGYSIAAEVSSDNFASFTLLYDNGFIPIPTTGYVVSQEALSNTLLAGNTYKFRYYFFDENNNNNPNGSVTFDDLFHDLSCNEIALVDTDGDGIDDHLDLDSDGDGVPDALEGNVDTDGDGVPDFLDTDSDNDGIPDGVEAQVSGVDTDGDGIDDLYDVDQTVIIVGGVVTPGGVDANGDGIDDSIAAIGTVDTDGDGTPDMHDADSDNDGIPDTLEPGDTDGDGIPNYLDTDSDNDGIPDGVEAQVSGVDTDGDGIDDLYDVDITGGVDADNDGVDDLFGASNTLDSDGDGIPNVRDLDSDGDGIPDAIEGNIDTDGDGVPDYLDLDSDNDGIPDVTEAGGVDTDGDGMPDSFTDNNGDGLDDAIAASPLPVGDFDGDGVADHLDLDSDGDGLADAIEAGGTDADGDGVIDAFADANGDGLDDALAITPLAFLDVDGDGMLDHLDLGVPPVATAVATNVAAGTTASVALASSISDAQGDEDLATIDLDPSTPGIDSTITTADGVWTVDATGALTFTPVPGFEGTAMIPYAVADANGEVSAPATVSVTVAGAIPVVSVDMASVASGATANIDLSDNLFDANNDVDITTIDLDPSTPGIESTVTTADGVWTIDATGALSFVPAAGFEGVAALAYAVSDDDGNVSVPANVTVTVAGATPFVTVDAASVASGVTASIDLSDNLFDANNDVDLATIDLDPSTPGIESTVTTADGVWTVDATGALSFVPAAGFEGVAALAYAVSDDDGNVSAPANVTVTVAGAAPTVTVDAASVASGVTASIDLSDNLFDANNDVDIATIDLDPSTPGIETTVTTADGIWTVDATGALSFAPVSGFEGVAALAYAVSDDDGNVSAPANVTVTVAGAAPVVTVDAASVASGVTASIDLSDNLFDANNDVDITTIDLDPSTPGIESTVTTADGVWTVDATGALSFVPVTGFEGTAALAYAVSDINGNVSAPANVTVTVGGATPTVTVDAASVASGVTAAIDLSDNLFDTNNDVDIATIDLDPSTPGIESTVTTADGVWTVDATGALSFVPAPGFEGVAALAYAVSDDDGNVSSPANVTVTVAGAAPVVTVDMASVATGATASIDLSDNLFDANNDVNIATIDLDPSTPGIESTVTTADGVWTVDAAGALSFVPVPGFEGAAALAYAVSDVNGNVSTPANVTVTVAGAVPVVTVDSASVASGVTANIDLSDNLFDVNNDVDIATIDLDPSTPGIESTVTTADGVWTVDATGALSFVPVAGFEGVAALAYAVSDDDGNVSAPANVTVTVAGATPMVTADSVSVAAGVTASIDLSDNLFDANNDVDIATIDLDPSTPGIESAVTTADGVWTVDAAGALSFVPVPGFEGVAALAYAVSDDDGNVSAPANVTVTVAGAAPVVTAESASVASGVAATIDLSDNLFDANNDADITTIDLDPSTPGIESTVTTADGVWSVDASGGLSFVPAPGFEGVAALAYAVSDSNGNVSAPANVTVTVAGAAPIATADSATTPADTSVAIALADNISDVNGDADLATIELIPSTPVISNPLAVVVLEGVWSIDTSGVVTFTPATGFEGSAAITYTVADAAGNVSAPAALSVTVAGAIPVVTADAASIATGSIASVDLSDNLSDANNDVDITTIDLDPSTPGVQGTLTTADGVWSVDAAGTLEFIPAAGFEGVALLPVTVSDDDGNVSLPENVTVTVGGATPVVTADAASTANATITTVDLSDNLSDPNNDVALNTVDLDPATAGIQNTITTAEGVWSVNAAGLVSFDPDPAFEGIATIAYTVSDDDGNVAAPANVSVTVAGAIPVATADTAAIVAGGAGSVDLSDNISDSNNDADVTTIDLDPSVPGIQNTLTTSDGVWTIDPAGLLSFTPVAGFQGVALLDYTVSDAAGNMSLPATVTVSVGSAAPIADSESVTTVQGVDVVIDVLVGDVDANNDINVASIDLDPATAGPQYTVVIAGEGIFNLVANKVVFDPEADFSGVSSIDYTVSDVLNNVSNVASVTVTVEADNDGDGISDLNDLDDDNDGIPDLTEGTGDTDGDGIPDSFDLDSDNDGLTDVLEAGGIDADGDGIIDSLSDTDGDGLNDSTAVAPLPVSDTDGNGVADYLDLDSDGDGIDDTTEAGDDPTAPLDADGDGIADHLALDSDADGIPDSVEGTADTDGDGVPDNTDTDADGDGIPDSLEAGPTPAIPLDTDGDGTPDYAELDSDDDGIADDIEAGSNAAEPVDTDGNGVPDFQEPEVPDPAPVDPEPVVDPADLDSDGDGIPDSVEFNVDSDGDAIPDYLDHDSDNDGIPDAVEGVGDTDGDNVSDFLDADSDNDGITDAVELADDQDADGVADFRDLDVDNDGIYDLIEARVGQLLVVELDADNDGIVDFLAHPYSSNGMADIVETAIDSGQENYALSDVDGDGVPDFRDLDSDNDGLLDTEESDHVDENINGIIDTVADRPPTVIRRTVLVDSFGLASDAGGLPRNTDGDGLADFRDGDSDNDGIMDIVESFGVDADTDNDGVFDDFTDADGDGVDDNWLAAPLAPADTDADGIPDASEIDADGDGISDLIESGGLDADGDGSIDNFADADADGVDDTVAVVPGAYIDSDGDGAPDFQDLDSDNDGLSDIEESGGIDADGDGVADAPAIGAALPDSDGDGIPDYQEVDGAVVVDPTPEQGEANGLIYTGLSGSGCAISPTLINNTQGLKKVDPMLPMISMLALAGLAVRRRSQLVVKKAGKAASVAAVAIGSLFLGGCATSGMSELGDTSESGSGLKALFSSDAPQDYEDRIGLGVYAAAGIGPSRMEPDTSEMPGWDPNDRVEPAGQITLGVDLNKWLSLEAHSADLGSAGMSNNGVDSGRINYHIDGISALLYAGADRHRFRRQGLTGYGRVGLGVLENTQVGGVPFEKVNGTHILFGAGVEYMTPFGVGLRAEGIAFDKDAQYAQLGLMYRMGRKNEVERPVLAKAPVIQEPVVAAVAPPPPPAPMPALPDPCEGISGVLEGVNFHSDKSDLTNESMLILDDVAYTLQSCAQMQVEISAHTDSVGAESYNQSLSERRAQSVVDYLSGRGLDRYRFNPTAFGESQPIDTNDTAQGRARNRRVELYAR